MSENSVRRLFRSEKDKMIGGVCGGFAEYLNIDVTLVRIIWVILTLFSGIGLLAYIISMILLPVNPDHKDLPQEQKAQHGGRIGLIIGVVLVVMGIGIIGMDHFEFDWFFPFPGFAFWPLNSDFLWPVLLLAAGGWLVYNGIIRSKSGDNGSSASEQKIRSLYRSNKVKMVAGVCGGLSEYWHIDVTIVRIAAIILTLALHFWVGIFVYIVMIIAIPEAPSSVVNDSKE